MLCRLSEFCRLLHQALHSWLTQKRRLLEREEERCVDVLVSHTGLPGNLSIPPPHQSSAWPLEQHLWAWKSTAAGDSTLIQTDRAWSTGQNTMCHIVNTHTHTHKKNTYTGINTKPSELVKPARWEAQIGMALQTAPSQCLELTRHGCGFQRSLTRWGTADRRETSPLVSDFPAVPTPETRCVRPANSTRSPWLSGRRVRDTHSPDWQIQLACLLCASTSSLAGLTLPECGYPPQRTFLKMLITSYKWIHRENKGLDLLKKEKLQIQVEMHLCKEMWSVAAQLQQRITKLSQEITDYTTLTP